MNPADSMNSADSMNPADGMNPADSMNPVQTRAWVGFVTVRSAKIALIAKGNSKFNASHGNSTAHNKADTFLQRLLDACGAVGGTFRTMEHDDYFMLLRCAFTVKIIIEKDTNKLILAISDALGQCVESDAVLENRELFAALLPVPTLQEVLFARYPNEWKNGDVENVGAMLSGNAAVLNLVPIMTMNHPEDPDLDKFYMMLFADD